MLDAADPVGVFRYGGTTGRPDGRVGLAVFAGVALLLSMRTPRLGSRLGWVYPVVMSVAAVAILVVDAAWWLTRSDPRAAAVAGVAGLWLWLSARERIRVLERRREELVAVGRRRVRDPRVRG